MIRVLLVDDERFSIRGMLEMVPWEKWNCEVVGTADSGLTALELLRHADVDLVFTDIRMPEVDGLELIRRAGEIQPGLRFVIISGYGEFDYARRAMQYGVQQYLLKPVGLAEIEEILLSISETFIRESRQRRGAEEKSADVDLGPYLEKTVLAVTGKDWNSVGRILLDIFKEISAAGGELEASRRAAIRFLSMLIEGEVIFSDESTLMLAGKIGSAVSQSEIYNILKDQILLTQTQTDVSLGERLNPHIQKILIHLLTHYRDRNLTLKWLSENIVFVKPDYLGKLFHQETGKSFAAYLAEYRVSRACEVLKRRPDIHSLELAELCGYGENSSYFIRQFKKFKGMTPGEFAAKSVVED